jgi:hypothetical protein
MACVYDDTLADDCTTPLNPSNCSSGMPYDVNGNPCPGSSSSLLAQVQAAQSASPVATAASTSNGGSALFGSILNFGTTVFSKVVPFSGTPTTGLRLQVNPATGQQQYYNPATGQYVGGPVNTGGVSGLLGGSSGFFLVIIALVVAFFMFGGKKRLAAA